MSMQQTRPGAGSRQMLRMFRPDNPAAALGLAVDHLMTKPAFANLRFGDWSRILVGQINRKHYYFVTDAEGQVQGFMGWALACEDHARAWAEGHRALTFEDSRSGDCIVINAWSANSTRVTRFMVEQARRLARDKTAIYFKRHYEDGATRAARISVNAFVNRHIERSLDRMSLPARQ
jgi:hemolysin-activating ACP:hemolysin acyltransferase